MPALVTRRFRIHNAKQFQEAISETSPSNLYFFISRVTPWSDDTSPPTPVDTFQESDFDIWKKMIGMKKIGIADITFAIPRYNWSTGTRYRQYDNLDSTLFNTPAAANTFYVVTEDYNVYKCLFNNKNALSTVKPTGTAINILTTSDGYKWKYMYTIDAGNLLKFTTNDWIPIKTLSSDDGSAQWDVQAAASNGAIEVINVTAAGNNYLYHTGTVAVTNANPAIYTLASTANTTEGIYTGSSMYLTSGTGAGQVRVISAYNGTNKRVTLSSAFTPNASISTTYQIAPTVTISGDGARATAYANVNNGVLSYVNVIGGGDSYSNSTIAVTANSSHGAGGTAAAIIPPPGGHGSDAQAELAGHNVILNTQLAGSEANTFMTVNNFRIMGLVSNPIIKSTQIAATDTQYDLSTKLTLTAVTGAGNYTQDEIITGGTSSATGTLAQFANTNSANTTGVTRLIDTNGSFAAAETVTGSQSGITATISTITTPTIEKYKGDIIYIENRPPITRSEDQIEDIKLIVKF